MDVMAKDEPYIIFSVLHDGKVHDSKENFNHCFDKQKGL